MGAIAQEGRKAPSFSPQGASHTMLCHLLAEKSSGLVPGRSLHSLLMGDPVGVAFAEVWHFELGPRIRDITHGQEDWTMAKKFSSFES